ncbi:rhodanese [Sediminicola sp. YIK13]|uniref:rhodanese-like domain-containing protein n=1 Tax=Sediminicola sp. YIK13 TaxID=1453352 RepID=UPI0007200584|nr:rhodanese-like domain-containing protein [Sediminicola sp. YIK13]ALM08058.1 rhodanese [Sediminicola sp. YIK13]
MKIKYFIVLLLFSFIHVHSQETIDEALQKYNTHEVPYLKVGEAIDNKDYLFLDARRQKEYDVSHIENATFVGTSKLNLEEMSSLAPDKNAPIIVYCSIGVRSEKSAKKLLEQGYTNVYNLYGGIFEWVNQGHPIVDHLGNETHKVHAFSKHWGKFLTKGEKVY